MIKKLFLFVFFCFVISFAQKEQVDGLTPEDALSTEIATLETADEITEIASEKNIGDSVNIDGIAQKKTATSDTLTSLTILTAPDSATILLNRKKYGLTPFSASQIEPTEYNIMLLKDGYELFDTTVNLQTGQKDTIFINLVSEYQKDENIETKNAAASKTRKTAKVKEETGAKEKYVTEISEEKKKKMDRIGIIIFLSVMLVLMGMQEAGNHR